MVEFKLLFDNFIKGSPYAILVALTGICWQWYYARQRDNIRDKQKQCEIDLERMKFEHQRFIEDLRFSYEVKRW